MSEERSRLLSTTSLDRCPGWRSYTTRNATRSAWRSFLVMFFNVLVIYIS
jgi:hypothetical protein